MCFAMCASMICGAAETRAVIRLHTLAYDEKSTHMGHRAPSRGGTTIAYGEQHRSQMKQSIVHVALVVRDYDEAIRFYTEKLNFTVVDDTYQPQQDKRWVLIAPPGSNGLTLLLARASAPEQERVIGNQTGGRVFLFLSTDDFWRDYHRMIALGITFVRAPKVESYGTVAVFEDLYGNLWDLLELSPAHSLSSGAV